MRLQRTTIDIAPLLWQYDELSQILVESSVGASKKN